MSTPLQPAGLPAGSDAPLLRPGMDAYALRTAAGQLADVERARGGATLVRGGSLPGNIRNFAYLNKMNRILAANPTTVYQIGGSPLTGRTETNAKASAGNVSKVVCKLNRPWTVILGDFFVMPWLSNGAEFYSNITITWTTYNTNTHYQVTAVLNLELIMVDFDETALTWNSYNSLDKISAGTHCRCDAELFPGSKSGSFGAATATFPVTAFPQPIIPSSAANWYGYVSALAHLYGSTVYGIGLSAKVDTDGGGPGLVENSFSGIADLNLNPTGKLATGFVMRGLVA